jgi:hypothetical protein
MLFFNYKNKYQSLMIQKSSKAAKLLSFFGNVMMSYEDASLADVYLAFSLFFL